MEPERQIRKRKMPFLCAWPCSPGFNLPFVFAGPLFPSVHQYFLPAFLSQVQGNVLRNTLGSLKRGGGARIVEMEAKEPLAQQAHITSSLDKAPYWFSEVQKCCTYYDAGTRCTIVPLDDNKNGIHVSVQVLMSLEAGASSYFSWTPAVASAEGQTTERGRLGALVKKNKTP